MAEAKEPTLVMGYLKQITELEEWLATEVANRMKLETQLAKIEREHAALLEYYNVRENVLPSLVEKVRTIRQTKPHIGHQTKPEAVTTIAHQPPYSWKQFVKIATKHIGISHGWQKLFIEQTGIKINKVQRCRIADSVPAEWAEMVLKVTPVEVNR